MIAMHKVISNAQTPLHFLKESAGGIRTKDIGALIELIPDEILLMVLKFLFHDTLINTAQVSKRWCRLSNDKSLLGHILSNQLMRFPVADILLSLAVYPERKGKRLHLQLLDCLKKIVGKEMKTESGSQADKRGVPVWLIQLQDLKSSGVVYPEKNYLKPFFALVSQALELLERGEVTLADIPRNLLLIEAEEQGRYVRPLLLKLFAMVEKQIVQFEELPGEWVSEKNLLSKKVARYYQTLILSHYDEKIAGKEKSAETSGKKEDKPVPVNVKLKEMAKYLLSPASTSGAPPMPKAALALAIADQIGNPVAKKHVQHRIAIEVPKDDRVVLSEHFPELGAMSSRTSRYGLGAAGVLGVLLFAAGLAVSISSDEKSSDSGSSWNRGEIAGMTLLCISIGIEVVTFVVWFIRHAIRDMDTDMRDQFWERQA